MSAMSISGVISKKVKPVRSQPVASFVIKEKEQTIRLVLYPYDGQNFYRVSLNGKMQFLTDISAADTIIKSLSTIK